MKSKIIANRVMAIVGLYTFVTVILWLYALVFYVEFQNAVNLVMLCFISVIVFGLPGLFITMSSCRPGPWIGI